MGIIQSADKQTEEGRNTMSNESQRWKESLQSESHGWKDMFQRESSTWRRWIISLLILFGLVFSAGLGGIIGSNIYGLIGALIGIASGILGFLFLILVISIILLICDKKKKLPRKSS